jgi:hypothetical protein
MLNNFEENVGKILNSESWDYKLQLQIPELNPDPEEVGRKYDMCHVPCVLIILSSKVLFQYRKMMNALSHICTYMYDMKHGSGSRAKMDNDKNGHMSLLQEVEF